jgi:hypothetical protein
VNNDVFFRFPLEMRNVEGTDGIERRDDCSVAFGALAGIAQIPADLTESAQHARAVESLAFAVVAEAHDAMVVWLRRPPH